jgi:hypothetical protein
MLYEVLKKKICGPVFDSELNRWCRRKNTELREITEVRLLTNQKKVSKTQMVWSFYAENRNH